jgi:drug/metabolite transporter (DMT)-like permease
MRPLGIVGAVLIVAGAVVLALRGVSYTKNRQTVQVGPLGVTTEQKGFIPPIIGVVAVVVGGVLMYSARRKA